MKAYMKMMSRFAGMLFMAAFVCTVAAGCNKGPKAIKHVMGDDGSKWEQVSLPGFGNKNNGSIVSMAEFQDRIYAVTRNDVSGFEIWRTRGRSWEGAPTRGESLGGGAGLSGGRQAAG